jgi:hypothetical protein
VQQKSRNSLRQGGGACSAAGAGWEHQQPRNSVRRVGVAPAGPQGQAGHSGLEVPILTKYSGFENSSTFLPEID